jgi:hypothetical protein
MATALRPRASASAMISRYGSHTLAVGARLDGGVGARSVDTSSLVAGFDGPESVDTSGVAAGFGGHARGCRWPARCAAGTSRGARARRLAAVCRHPRRCSWRRRNRGSLPSSTSRPLRVAAGLQVSITGRFWVSTEDRADGSRVRPARSFVAPQHWLIDLPRAVRGTRIVGGQRRAPR